MKWAVQAGLDGLIGLALGIALVPDVQRIILPLSSNLRGAPATD